MPVFCWVIALLATAKATEAQPLGTFRWQLQPFCNVVSVTVTQSGGVFRLDGTDDQCGSGDLASVVGTAFQNPDGTIGFGLTIVATPGGAPVHVDAEINVATLNGTWRDSAGHTGGFVFTPGTGTGGAPRPTTGTIGALAIDPTQVQRRIGGTCPSEQFMQAINENGTVTCAAGAGSGDITGVTAGAGLTGGGTSGDVALGLALTGTGAFSFGNVNGFASAGTFRTGALGLSGAGTRLVWYPAKAAFRAGRVDGPQWDTANIGEHSAAFGRNTLATAFGSTAMGNFSVASGDVSTALGAGTSATGDQSTALGLASVASGTASTALGMLTVADGPGSTAMGNQTLATGDFSVVGGAFSTAAGSTAVALGVDVHASGDGSVVLGSHANALIDAPGTFIFADRSTNNAIVGFAPNEFFARAAGGVAFYTNAALTAGVSVAPGGGAWQSVSDRNRKHLFRHLSGEQVLRKLARMPIQEWSYKSQDASIRHVGPTAQDFHEAFGLGEDPLRINTVDADGIALAAIRALEARTSALIRENERLRARLERLERQSRRR